MFEIVTIILETSLLTDPFNGVYTVTSYYSDGTIEVRQVPKGELISPVEIF